MKNLFPIIILQLLLVTGCKKRTINETTLTPNQLENHIKNGDNTYSINGEKVLDNETEDSKTYENYKESIENKNQTIKNDNDNDFEYSEYWRKEAFKASKQFLRNILSEQNCNTTAFSYYQPNLIRYIGHQGYRVKIRCSFDCYKNPEHRKYFWVESYYYGNNKWEVILIGQKYDD